MRRREIAAVIGGGRMLFVREGTRHPGNVLAGAINHLAVTVMGQPVGSCEITGMPALVGHLPHRNRLKMRVGGPFDLRRVNTAIDHMVLPVKSEVIVHMRIMEKVIGVMAMLEVIKRMGRTEVIKITKRKAVCTQAEPKINTNGNAIKGASAVSRETRARRQRRPTAKA
jgi:hypothetical protein